MSDTPSWLTEENISTAKKVTANPVAQSTAKSSLSMWTDTKKESEDVETGKSAAKPDKPKKTDAKAGTDVDIDIDPDVLKEMDRWHLALRIAYCGAAVFLATAAALSLSSQTDLGLVFFAFYVLFFSAIICCFEVALTMAAKLIAVNFGFMYTLPGRAIFLILVGFMSYLLSLLGKLAMGLLFGVALVQVYVMYKFPRYEEYLRKKHFYEGRAAKAALRSAKV